MVSSLYWISTHGCVRSGHINITVVSQQTTINPLSDTIWYHCKWQDPPSLPTTYFAIDQSPEAVKTWKITLRLGEIWSSLEVLQCQRISESSFICLPHFNTTKTYLTIPGVVDPSPTRTLAFAVCYIKVNTKIFCRDVIMTSQVNRPPLRHEIFHWMYL